jgi:hypothetical protein
MRRAIVIVLTWGLLSMLSAEPSFADLGLFERNADVGQVSLPGSAQFDAATKQYRVTGSGANMWGAEDAFHFVWCQASGDLKLSARVAFEGGAETRLTTAPGLDDGPEYSPDGRHIYFNSVRSGLMKIWRMRRDGKWLVFISYDRSVEGHPANKQVALRLMPTAGRSPSSATASSLPRMP